MKSLWWEDPPPQTFKRRNPWPLFCPQPRSCLKTSLRVDRALEEEPGVAWTCRKLHHRAEVASAAAVGTNTATHPLIQPIPQLRSTRPVTTNPRPDQLPSEQHSTNELLANEWPVNCQTPSPQWFQLMNQSAEQEIHPLESCFKHPDFPIHLLVKDTRRHLRGKNSQSWKKTKSAIPGLWGPSYSPWFFSICAVGKKKIKQEGILAGWPCPLSFTTFFLKQHTFLKYFLHAAAFSVLFLETTRGFKPVERTDFPLVRAA